MGQENRFQRLGVEGEILTIADCRRAAPLNHAAIDQETPPTMPQNMTGASHFTGCTVKLDLHGQALLNSARRHPISSVFGYIVVLLPEQMRTGEHS
jgi:hypothetical protein